MDANTVIALIGLAVTVLGGQFLMWRWLVTKMREDRNESEKRDAELHTRINEVKDNYVRQDHLMQHINRIEAAQAQMSNSLQGGFDRLHGRIDQFLGKTTQGNKGD